MTAWHKLSVADCAQELGTDPERGLSPIEVAARRERFGRNELQEAGGRGFWLILWEQVRSAMIALLAVAAAVSLILGESTDAIVILAIMVLNATLGLVQDYRAERAMAALKKLAVPTVRVRRDGLLQEISASELVPGDIVQVEVGNTIPADCRVEESANLQTQEAALTGESIAVEKDAAPLAAENPPLGDRRNMLYMGTSVTFGHGQAIVTATGMETELGQIAKSLQAVKTEPTPLQRRLNQLSRTLALIALAIVAFVFALGLLYGEDPRVMLLTALSMAVAVVPEGLPAVATVALAVGAKRMFDRQALIRKLPAVETLGSVTVICSDKTGTLTENKMSVATLEVAGSAFEIPKSAGAKDRDKPMEEAASASLQEAVTQQSGLALLLAGAALCNDAELQTEEAQGESAALGDPTEVALLVAADRYGLSKTRLANYFPRLAEVPFDSDRKRMTTLHAKPAADAVIEAGPLQAVCGAVMATRGAYVAFTKGAVDSILQVCSDVWSQEQPQPLDEAWQQRIAATHERLAAQGMRVLGVALRGVDTRWLPDEQSASTDGQSRDADDAAAIEQGLVFVGIVAMIDPPRPEVARAVAACQSAGIRPVMITGDHPLTALHIAKQLMITQVDRVLTGQELEAVDSTELEKLTRQVSVYARVAPKQKLRLVRALQNAGQVVAMTGDGVNDAPALRQAHIGVAMGISGTDVSKEASQMVLLDDNFATIVNAVEQGRVVYDNIRKFVQYTMTSNAGEVFVMVLAPLLGMPLPLLPLQILWINLVTDGLPGLALAIEKAEADTMCRPPYPPQEHVFGRGMAWNIAWIGSLMGVVPLVLSIWYWPSEETDLVRWRTIVFTVLTLAQLGNALAFRSNKQSLFQIGVFSNPVMLVSVVATFALQMLVVYWPPLQEVFTTTSLSGGELLACLLLSSSVFWAVEGHKWLIRSGRMA